MAQSQCMVELCALLVHETYGELASRIFTILLRRGRLPIPTLSRHTRLTPKQLRHGLVVLVQQNLIYYHTDTPTGVTHYEANYNTAYALVRSGKILSFVEARYGTLARELVHGVLLLGHTKISDLFQAYDAQKAEQARLVQLARQEALRQEEEEEAAESHESHQASDLNGSKVSHVNGFFPDPVTASPGQLHTALAKLFDGGLLERVVGSMFRSPADIQDELEKDLARESAGGTKTAKQKTEFANRLKHKVRDLRKEGSEWRPYSKKRHFNGDHTNGINGPSKRRRLAEGAANGESHYEDDGSYLDPDLIIRLNYEKCTVILRNAQLIELAKQKIGNTTSQIYGQLLNLLEPKLVRCRSDMDDEDYSSPTATMEQIAAALDKDIDPGFGIGKAPSDRVDKAKVEKPNQVKPNSVGPFDASNTAKVNGKSNGVNGKHVSNADEYSGEESDDPFASPVRTTKRPKVTFQDEHVSQRPSSEDKAGRLREVRKHIELLQHNDCPFLHKSALNGGGGYSVNFEMLVDYMREIEMDQLLLDMFGDKGLRLIRILKKYGKVDEKALEKTALIKQKDVRTKLAEMQMAGIVEIQEVPKDANRNNGNSRTIFLWFYDRDRVLQVLLDRVIKAISRLLQRLTHERRGAQSILELIERSDLRHADPETYLEPHQYKDLQNICHKEAMLMGQIGRLDELVGIFRDY